MQSLIFKMINSIGGVKRTFKKKILLKIIQSCLYLLFIDGFLENKIFCAASPDTDLIKETIIGKCSEVIEKEIDCLLLESLKSKFEQEYSKITISNMGKQGLPSTSESAQFQSKSLLFEEQIDFIKSEFNLLLTVRIPNCFEDLNELNDLYIDIQEKINIIKENPQSCNSAFIKRIEKKLREKQKINLKIKKTLNNMISSTEKIKSSFKDIVNVYLNMKTTLFFIGSKILDHYGYTFISKTDAENKRMLKSLSATQLALDEDESQANKIYMILSKFLEMTPEDFNADFDVINAILSLK